jgi:hypothetical protein
MQSDVPQLGETGLILEGIVTTENSDGTVNVAPMGPIVDPAMNRFVLRPYQSSTTYKNLKRQGKGVLHVTDDVELFAAAAVGQAQPQLDSLRIVDACRWYDFQVASLDDAAERTTIVCEVSQHGAVREFFGFNRAKHAVIEAAILVTRWGLLPREEILRQFDQLRELVKKTGGASEHRAFAQLSEYLANQS